MFDLEQVCFDDISHCFKYRKLTWFGLKIMLHWLYPIDLIFHQHRSWPQKLRPQTCSQELVHRGKKDCSAVGWAMGSGKILEYTVAGPIADS